MRTLQAEQLQSELAAARDSLRQAEEAARSSAVDAQRFKEQADELAAQGRALSEMQQQAQKYNAQLQEYNTRMQGEVKVGAHVCCTHGCCISCWVCECGHRHFDGTLQRKRWVVARASP